MFNKIKSLIQVLCTCKSKICYLFNKKNNNSLSINIYNKVDKLVKDDDGVIYIESNEGLTESEFLNILNNELIRKQ